MAADYPLRPLVSVWLKKIKLAHDFKKAQFQDDADEAMAFFDGPYDFLYGVRSARGSRSFFYTGGGDKFPRPAFGMTVNKVAEMVQLFGPVLYHRNPIRQVNPREFPTPSADLLAQMTPPPPGMPPEMAQQYVAQQSMMVQQQVQQARGIDVARAQLLQAYLNYTPNALGLKDQARYCIDEAIIKGMGLLWPMVYTPRGAGHKLVGSFYDTVDNLVIDPDMESLDEAKWVAQRCVHPVWQVEEEYGLAPGTLRGTFESFNAQAEVAATPEGDYKRKTGQTNDLLVYWKVFSKMGMGGKLAGIGGDVLELTQGFGDFCFLVVCERADFLLNLPPESLQQGTPESLQQATGWPTPYWADDKWPFCPVLFHQRPRKVWPMSHLKPGMGELKFINWVYSFVATKIKTACRDLIAIKKSVGEEVKNAILHGADHELIEIEDQHGTITEIVQFLQHPNFQGDIWKVLEAVEANFEKRVGLTELMYGQSASAMRSASEANVKADQLRIRPDDMANKVEDAMTDTARMEALAARWHLEAQDVQPVLGPVGAYFWQQLLVASDPAEVLHSLEYRIEAGSARKPNKERDAQNMQQAMQGLFQPFWGYASATGNVGPVNALIADWAKSIDLDASRYMLAPPPPPPAPAPGGEGQTKDGPPRKGPPQPGGQ